MWDTDDDVYAKEIALALCAFAALLSVWRRTPPRLAPRFLPRDAVEAAAKEAEAETKAGTKAETKAIKTEEPFVAPASTRLQASTTRNVYAPPVPAHCVVTGGTGFVGQRLVEMLIERGAERVIAFDIVPKPEGAWDHPNITYVVGDIRDAEAVKAACKGADCVWHIAAAVGPYHPQHLYDAVNYQGTLNVIQACREGGVPKLVMSSSPSTRFDGSDVDGLTEDDMPSLPQKSYLQPYASSKAKGEMAVSAANDASLMTVSVAPHQVYGPRDCLFLPNILEAAGSGLLRVFASARTGYGLSRVCFTHVDNYCHGLIIAERALFEGSPALGKFYIVTDGDTHPFSAGYQHLWIAIEEVVQFMGFPSIRAKVALPDWLMFPAAYACEMITKVTGIRLKLNVFSVRMLTIDRWFKITAAENDLGYKPIVNFSDGWLDTMIWFRQHWLPDYLAQQQGSSTVTGIAKSTQGKIDIQAR